MSKIVVIVSVPHKVPKVTTNVQKIPFNTIKYNKILTHTQFSAYSAVQYSRYEIS